jgi:hypothetical protein
MSAPVPYLWPLGDWMLERVHHAPMRQQASARGPPRRAEEATGGCAGQQNGTNRDASAAQQQPVVGQHVSLHLGICQPAPGNLRSCQLQVGMPTASSACLHRRVYGPPHAHPGRLAAEATMPAPRVNPGLGLSPTVTKPPWCSPSMPHGLARGNPSPLAMLRSSSWPKRRDCGRSIRKQFADLQGPIPWPCLVAPTVTHPGPCFQSVRFVRAAHPKLQLQTSLPLQ